MLIQIIFTLVFALAVYMTWRRERQHAVRRLEAVLWTALWLAAAVVVWRPETSSAVAHVVGIGRGADLVVYGSLVLLFILIFRIYVSLDRLERHLTTLVRREALDTLEKSRQKTEDRRQ